MLLLQRKKNKARASRHDFYSSQFIRTCENTQKFHNIYTSNEMNSKALVDELERNLPGGQRVT